MGVPNKRVDEIPDWAQRQWKENRKELRRGERRLQTAVPASGGRNPR
jgi:hypothetical protein